jgi:hypothetical protein
MMENDAKCISRMLWSRRLSNQETTQKCGTIVGYDSAALFDHHGFCPAAARAMT